MPTRHTFPAIAAAIAFAVLLLGGGCGSSPATRFYVLDATAEPGAPVADTVGLGPVQLPPYVDHDGIITRNGPTALALAEFDQWAEPLQDGFERVLLQDLSIALGASHVELHPWGAAKVSVRVPVQVLRFDSDEDGTATLAARWSILSADHVVIVPARISTITVDADGKDAADAKGAPALGIQIALGVHTEDFSGATGALSRSIGRLAAEIADALRASTGGR